MLDQDKKQFAQIVRSTMLVTGGEAPEPDVLRIWWASLQNYEIADVSAAFSEYAMRGKFAPKPADILGIIDRIKPDGRPGADEAWAMIPMDEYTSAVMTQEMAEAMHVAQPLLDAGDKIGARMAFREVYNRIVEANKRNGVRPSWFPSLGQDKEGRDTVLAEAVRLGRISADHAIGLLPPEKVAPMLQNAGHEKLALEYKLPSAEESMKRIQALKDALKRKVA